MHFRKKAGKQPTNVDSSYTCSCEPLEWKPMKTAIFLKMMGCGDFSRIFIENNLSIKEFILLSEEQLKKVQVTEEVRRTILGRLSSIKSVLNFARQSVQRKKFLQEQQTHSRRIAIGKRIVTPSRRDLPDSRVRQPPAGDGEGKGGFSRANSANEMSTQDNTSSEGSSASQSQVIVKVKCADEVRKMKIGYPFNLRELKKAIKLNFELRSTSDILSLKYRDLEGDKITISSNLDLDTAVEEILDSRRKMYISIEINQMVEESDCESVSESDDVMDVEEEEEEVGFVPDATPRLSPIFDEFERLEEPVVVVDCSGVVYFSNKASEDFLGYESVYLRGVHVGCLFSKEQNIEHRLEYVMKNESCRTGFKDILVLKRDGSLACSNLVFCFKEIGRLRCCSIRFTNEEIVEDSKDTRMRESRSPVKEPREALSLLHRERSEINSCRYPCLLVNERREICGLNRCAEERFQYEFVHVVKNSVSKIIKSDSEYDAMAKKASEHINRPTRSKRIIVQSKDGSYTSCSMSVKARREGKAYCFVVSLKPTDNHSDCN